MRILILTLPLHTNYGGILQAYALQTVLERMGHDVSVISRKNTSPFSLRLLFLRIPKRIIFNLLGKKEDVFREFKHQRNMRIINKHVSPFIEKYIHEIKINVDKIKESDYDAIVVGSDQIWRPIYISKVLKSSVDNAFLDFAKEWKIKRIAYAASFGTDSWEYSYEETKRICTLISQFDAVSVREFSGVELCKKYLNTSALQLLDPTLLLDSTYYIKLFQQSNTPQSDGKLFSYILDPSEEKQSIVDKIASSKKLKPFSVCGQPDNPNVPIEMRIQPPVEKWLRGFFDADFVVTDSFHGCVFSIIFNKPFVAIGNVKRGLARFDSLLNLFNINDHLLSCATDYREKYSYEIPDISLEILQKYRQKSLSFLTHQLEN